MRKNFKEHIWLAAPIAVFLFLCFHFNVTQDDAFITFRFAENYLNGYGLVWNIGERVEGYTNFLWLLLLIVGKQLGLSYLVTAKGLGIVSSVGSAVLTFQITRSYAPKRIAALAGVGAALLLATNYAFAYWSTAGLETALFAFLTLLALYWHERRSLLLGPALALAILTRPEGALLAGFVLLVGVVSVRGVPRFELRAVAIAALTLVPYAVFKLAYFGDLAPNPFYAKTVWDVEQVFAGLSYYGMFLKSYAAFGLVPLAVAVWIVRTSRFVRVLFAFFALYSLYIIVIGGDVLKMHRFFLPLVAPLYVSFVLMLLHVFYRPALRVAAVAALIVYQTIVPYQESVDARSVERGLLAQNSDVVRALKSADTTNFSLATSTIGITGFLLGDRTVFDMVGLTDSTVARHPQTPVEGLATTWRERKYNAEYILRQKPDYIFFSTGAKPSSPGERVLFLYPEFIRNYDLISFYSPAGRRDIELYRRADIPDTVRADLFHPVNSAVFVQQYHDALTALSRNEYRRAVITLDSARRSGPQPTYAPLYYFSGMALAGLGRHQESFQALSLSLERDSSLCVSHEAMYQSLYQYPEMREQALRHRASIQRLAPWRLPLLDQRAGFRGH